MGDLKAMLFDLDGTLLDSAPDLVRSLNRVRELAGYEAVPVAEYARHASRGAIGLLEAGMPEADAELFEKWRQQFLDHYAENSLRDTALYRGVPELLKRLGDRGIPWGIVTNKIESLTRPILEAFRLDESISCLVCGDTLGEKKPHPAPVELACDLLGVKPADTLFVGDDIRDIQAGLAAGTRTAAIHYGYGSFRLKGSVVGDSYPVHHPSDLMRLVS